MPADPQQLTPSERKQIEEILTRRSNEIATFSMEYQRDKGHYGSVEFALSREIQRLRRLAERVNPPETEEETDHG
ncbi:hypothetical protein ACFJIX_17820 [Roseateles sp. UC29_93]|uniref:hypothetical protein n=1 Tax=Roseateles sp. UC29_93 TaxID=3350177 RepID=UPI0036709125